MPARGAHRDGAGNDSNRRLVSFRLLQDLDVQGKRVLVREDLNVPLDDQGLIADYARIDAALPTLRWLHEHHARTIILSHLGRPEGTRQPHLSLRPVARALSDRLGIPVAFADDCVGEAAERAVKELHDGDVLLLENVRFHPEEERNDPAFAQQLVTFDASQPTVTFTNPTGGTIHAALKGPGTATVLSVSNGWRLDLAGSTKPSVMKAVRLRRQRAMCAAMLLPDELFRWSGSAHPSHAKRV